LFNLLKNAARNIEIVHHEQRHIQLSNMTTSEVLPLLRDSDVGTNLIEANCISCKYVFCSFNSLQN